MRRSGAFLSLSILFLSLFFQVYMFPMPSASATVSSFSDDFEDNLDSWDPDVNGNSSATITSSQHHSGSSSVELYAQSTGAPPNSFGNVELHNFTTWDIPSKHLYLSFWVMVTQIDDDEFADIASFGTYPGYGVTIHLHKVNGIWYWHFTLYDATLADHVYDTNATLNMGIWTHVLIETYIDPTNGYVSFYTDDVLAENATGYDLGGALNVDDIRFYSITPDYDFDTTIVYIDDFTLNDFGIMGMSFDITNKVTAADTVSTQYWTYVEEKYYHFQADYSYSLGWVLFDTLKIGFSDGLHPVVASYDVSSHVFTLLNGSDHVFLKGGTVTALSNTTLRVDYMFYLRRNMLDIIGAIVYGEMISGVYTSGVIDTGFSFNIYSRGGIQDYTLQGSGGKGGGGAFDIYAGGQYFNETTLLLDTFDPYPAVDPGWLMDIPYFGVNPSSPLNNISVTPTVPGIIVYPGGYSNIQTPERTMILHKGNTGVGDLMMTHRNFNATTGLVNVQFYFYAPQNDKNFEAQLWSSTNTVGIELRFNATGHYEYFTAGEWVDEGTYNATTWYNVTMAINISSSTFDLYVNGILIEAGCYMNAPVNDLASIYFMVNPVVALASYDFYVDEVHVWKDRTQGSGGYAEETILYRKLQNVNLQYAIGIAPQGPSASEIIVKDANEGFLEVGMDYLVNGAWVNNAWKVRLNVTAARLTSFPVWGTAYASITGQSNANWIQVTASWYTQNDTYAGSQIFYSFWEGEEGSAVSGSSMFRLWTDLWFANSIWNSGTVNATGVGSGRVATYYSGMVENTPGGPLFRAISGGGTWNVLSRERQQSMFSCGLKDSAGAPILVQQIEMARVRLKVWRSSNYDYAWEIRDFDTHSFKQAEDEMQGVSTPAFVEAKVPALPFGWVPSTASIPANMWEFLAQNIWKSLLNMFSILISFMDSIAAQFGSPTFFSDMLAVIVNFTGYVTSFLVSLTLLISQIYTLFTGPLVLFFSNAGTFFLSIITAWTTLGSLNLGTIPGTQIIAEIPWTTVILLGTMVWLFGILEVAGQKGFVAAWAQVEVVINIFSYILGFLFRIVEFTINLIFRLVESVPVIE